MADETLTEYERQRLENIRANNQLLESLNLKGSALPILPKPSISRKKENKKPTTNKAAHVRPPARASLRLRGVDPDGSIAKRVAAEAEKKEEEERLRKKARRKDNLKLMDINSKFKHETEQEGKQSRENVMKALKILTKFEPDVDHSNEKKFYSSSTSSQKLQKSITPGYRLLHGASKKVVNERITTAVVHPNKSSEFLLAFVGDKIGSLGIWKAPLDELPQSLAEENASMGDVTTFLPHSRGITQIIIASDWLYSASYDGSIRRFGFGKDSFESIYAHPDDESLDITGITSNYTGESIYFCTSQGK